MKMDLLNNSKQFLQRWCITKITTQQFALLAAAGVLLDQLTKQTIVQNIAVNKSTIIIPYLLDFYYVRNTGASFSLLPNATLFLTIFSAAAAITILAFYKKIPSQQRLFFAFILAGTLGNFIDRIRLGYVIDFIDFKIWPVFNVADSLVTLGAISLIYVMMRSKQ